MTATASLPSSERRRLAREARDAFPPMGVIAIVDRTTGRARVLSTRNVHALINRIHFGLRLGTHTDKALQAEWNAVPENFEFRIVELVKERRDDPAFDYAAELAELEQLHRMEFEWMGNAR